MQSQAVVLPELLCDKELELLRLQQVQVFPKGIPLLYCATVGQRQVPQLVHVLEEQPLHLHSPSLSLCAAYSKHSWQMCEDSITTHGMYSIDSIAGTLQSTP